MDLDGREKRHVSSPSTACGGGLGRGNSTERSRGANPLPNPNPPPQPGDGIASGFALLYLAYLRRLAFLAFAFAFAFALASAAHAEKGKLRERLTPDVMAVVYPGAERLGPEEGSPPAIAVYRGDKTVAYIFSTLDIIAAPGYSVTPFDVIAGVDLDGRITGAKVVFHREPYIYHDAVRQPLLDTFLAREAGMPLRGGATMLRPEFVAGAT